MPAKGFCDKNISSQGGEACAFNTTEQENAKNASYNADGSEEEEMRKWAKGDAARVFGGKEEKEETQEGRVTEIESEGSISPITAKAVKANRPEWSSGEDRKPSGKKKKKTTKRGGTRICAMYRLGLWRSYGQNPSYAKVQIEEGRMDSLKGRFTHWVMASMVDFLLGEVEVKAISSDTMTPEQSKEAELENHEDKGDEQKRNRM